MENKFSILVLINSKDNIKENISIFLKNKCFSKLEIILLDITQDNRVKKEIKQTIEGYNNFVYIDVRSKSESKAYNIGIEYATGNYISFIEQGMEYSNNVIKSVEKHIKEDKEKLICLTPLYKQEGIVKPYKMCPTKGDKINLIVNPLKLNLMLDSYFIDKHLLADKKFSDTLFFEDAKLKLLLEILIRYPYYYLLKDEYIYYSIAREDDTSTNFMQYNKEWYNKSLESFVIPFMKDIYEKHKEIPFYIQETMLYYIFAKYNCNLKDRNKMVLSKEEALTFFDNTASALQYINTNLILKLNKSSLFKMPRWLSYQFLLSKNRKKGLDTKIEIAEECLYLNTKDEKLNVQLDYILNNDIEKEHVNIYAINYSNSSLCIDFSISLQDVMKENDLSVFVKYADKIIEASKINCYPLLKVFGLTISKQIYFQVSIPIREKVDKTEIEFYFRFEDEEYRLKTKFIKVQAHLNNSKYSYWNFNKNYYLCNKQTHLLIERKRVFSNFVKEIKYFGARIHSGKNKKLIIKNFTLRLIYWIMYPIMKRKRIWVYYDKIYKAGDNAEYLYQYAKKQKDGIQHYYIVNKNSIDYQRLKRENANILVFGTTKQRLYCLYAEVILATHKNVISFCGFGGNSREHFRDLFNAEIMCIQHGLTMQAIAQHQNRLEDNTKLYLCASKYEIENLSKPIYNYNKDSLKLVGLARFDGLINQDKRQILICPTWRKDSANTKTRMGNTREYTEEFKNSKYFEIFNSIINNQLLINTAKELDYKIIFLLHPVITSQVCDFDTNGYVKVLTVQDGISYEQLLTESSLMVTDYSGVQYDFAYMRKPLVYFHPDELPAQYEDGGINYETMGFGPICKNREDLIKTLCEYMKNDCKTKQEYINRANDFFAFDDHNNCERIYNTIKKYMNERK